MYVGLECLISGQANLDAVLTGTDQHKPGGEREDPDQDGPSEGRHSNESFDEEPLTIACHVMISDGYSDGCRIHFVKHRLVVRHQHLSQRFWVGLVLANLSL